MISGAKSDWASDAQSRPHVLLWGPFPHEGGVFGGGIGGYARCNSQMLESILAEGARLDPLPMSVPRYGRPALAWMHLGPRMLDDANRVFRALSARRPDVLHITALYWRSIYREAYAVWMARRFGVPVLYDIRAGTFEQFTREARGSARQALDYVMRDASQITVEGERYRELVQCEFGRESAWVPNFIRDGVLGDHARASLSRPRDGEPFRLAFVGFLIPDKGVDVLLEAGLAMSATTPVEITLIGAESDRIRPYLAHYRSLQSDRFRIVLTGRLDMHALLARLREQHLFVFLSRFFGEGHSNAVTEAMAMGLPVLTARHGFLAEVVTDACGVIVEDSTDVGEVVRALEALHADWDGLVRRGRAARARVEASFSERPVLGTTLSLYRALAERR